MKTREQLRLEVEDVLAVLQSNQNATLQEKAKLMESAISRRKSPISFLLGLALCVMACTGPSGPEALDIDPASFAPQDTMSWETLSGASEVLLAAGAFMTDDPQGTPVFVKSQPDEGWDSDQTPDPDDLHECGNTYVGRIVETGAVIAIRIEIYWPLPHPNCYADLRFTLAHEMIHAARALAGLSYLGMPDEHSADGIFKAKAGSTDVEDTTKQKLCEAVACDAE